MSIQASVANLYYVKGEEGTLVENEIRKIVANLVGVTEVSTSNTKSSGGSSDFDEVCEIEHFIAGQCEIGQVIQSCSTPAFLTDKRIIVLRQIGMLSAAQANELVEYLKEPLNTTFLILVGGGGRISSSLEKLLKSSSALTVDVSVPSGAKAKAQWLDEKLNQANVKMDLKAKELLLDHIGEEVDRVDSLLETIIASSDRKAKITPDVLLPLLGAGGGVPPWELTDAIDTGDTDLALRKLSRMTFSGGKNAISILAILHRHFRDMFALDGSGAGNDAAAGEILGIASTFRAGKLRRQSTKLGSEKLARAIVLLQEADLDLRGRIDWPAELIMEVLVARLSRLPAQGVQRR